MIRINLAKPQKYKPAATSSESVDDSIDGAMTVSDEEIRKQGMIRLLIIFLFPAFLYAWELHSLPQKQGELANRQTLLASLENKNLEAKTALEEITKFQAEQNKIQTQIDIIEGLKRGRMQEVKVLDSIQRMIPSKVWLHKIEMVNGKLVLLGHAATDIGLTSFMDALSRSIFLRDISLVRSTDFQDDKVGVTVKKFEISCLVEKVL